MKKIVKSLDGNLLISNIPLFAEQLKKSFETTGFAKISNLVDQNLVDKFYEKFMLFCALPDDIKRKYIIEGASGQAGFTPFKTEQAKGGVTPDLKEFFQFHTPIDDTDNLTYGYPENPVVSEVEGFTELGFLNSSLKCNT
jgi:isopenicillin N synthase-like dioxygenase